MAGVSHDRHIRARRLAQRLGADPRYLRRLRWVSKVRALRRVGAPLRAHLGYVLLDPEVDNFTYELGNQAELAEWVQAICHCGAAQAAERLDEPGADAVLQAQLRTATAAHRLWSKTAPPFGKRLAWYAVARELRPELIVETGVHDGLASLLLLRALERNAAEGSPGRLLSFDINPAAGWLADAHHLWELTIAATRPALAEKLAGAPPVGLFVHDSLHTYENERYEFETVAEHLAPDGVLITDNAHATPALREIAGEQQLEYAEFAEAPIGHFYTGGSMGAAYRRCARSS